MTWIPVARVAGAITDAVFGLCCSRIASKGATINVSRVRVNDKNGKGVALETTYVGDAQTYNVPKDNNV